MKLNESTLVLFSTPSETKQIERNKLCNKGESFGAVISISGAE